MFLLSLYIFLFYISESMISFKNGKDLKCWIPEDWKASFNPSWKPSYSDSSRNPGLHFGNWIPNNFSYDVFWFTGIPPPFYVVWKYNILDS